MTMRDTPDDGRYNPATQCCICGMPRTAHRGVDDWSWQDEGIARHELDFTMVPSAVLSECGRFMQAEAAMMEAEASAAALDAYEAEAAELANRMWEQGLL